MKIYHTETQADYGALLIHLKELGYKYIYGATFSELRPYIVVLGTGIIMRSLLELTEDKEFKHLPIQKYEAKVNEMEFTKENVFGLFGQYRRNRNGISSLDDLEREIMNLEIADLDDTPEKVVVPKFVAEWIKYNHSEGVPMDIMLGCYKSFRDNPSRDLIDDGERAVEWFVKNPYKFVVAYVEGYEVEKEPLYYIPLPHLGTSDGIQQVLSQRENRINYFASTPHKTLKQRFTKEELAQVPEIYKLYAMLIEEAAND